MSVHICSLKKHKRISLKNKKSNVRERGEEEKKERENNRTKLS